MFPDLKPNLLLWPHEEAKSVNVLFTDDNQPVLIRHLQRTVCTDIANTVFNTVAADYMLSVKDENTITPEVSSVIYLIIIF